MNIDLPFRLPSNMKCIFGYQGFAINLAADGEVAVRAPALQRYLPQSFFFLYSKATELFHVLACKRLQVIMTRVVAPQAYTIGDIG